MPGQGSASTDIDDESAPPVALLAPSMALLPAYRAALERGWLPDNVSGAKRTQDELARIAADAPSFIAAQDDPEAKGPPYIVPDGTAYPRIPGYRRWIWDGSFCGFIGFRWQPGMAELPAHVLGHVGYGIVPWKRGRALAARALNALLPDARAKGLPYIEISTEETNMASRKTIERCGGEMVERFTSIGAYGATPRLRYRIAL